MLAEEVHTGRVLAMQGGFDVLGSSYNRTTQAMRQPGSSFKPIVYVTALENGFTPASIVVDAPYCVWQGAGLGQKCFVNFDRRYAGPHTMRWGVEQSRNLMTIRVAAETGMPKILKTARDLGVGDYPNYLSIAIGAGETTVLRMVNAFAQLANQGRSVKPTFVDYVEDRNGKVIYRTDSRCGGPGRCSTQWPRSRWSTSWKASSNAVPRPSCATSIARCSARPARPRVRPTYGSSAAPLTSSPASTWATISRARWAVTRKADGSLRRYSSNGRRRR
jgi:membrane carboxypeptidase/penicillin-binding protein